MEYPKIDTLFERDSVTHKLKEPLELKNPVYDAFKYFTFTEKIHGMNIRIILNEDKSVVYSGRSDKAVLPADLLKVLETKFTQEKLIETFWRRGLEAGQDYTPFQVILFGEGYGPGIQEGGGNLAKEKNFRLFDVNVSGDWLDWENVEDVARKFEVQTVPLLGNYSLEDAVEKVKKGIPSLVAGEEGTVGHMAEGMVGRPPSPLFDRKGRRIIIKLKTEDFDKTA